MLTAEERMELAVLRKHGAGIRELAACYRVIAQYGAAILA